MKILFLHGSKEILEDDWPHVPRAGDRVQIGQESAIMTFRVLGIVWKKEFVRAHVVKADELLELETQIERLQTDVRRWEARYKRDVVKAKP